MDTAFSVGKTDKCIGGSWMTVLSWQGSRVAGKRERAFNGSGSRAVKVWLHVAGDEDLSGDDII